MNSEVPQKQMFAVEVPAIVNNDGKLLDMLGGLDEVLRVFDSEKLRLRLRFRPKMIFAKPACGDPSQVTGLVLSVKQYKNRLTGETKLVPTVIARVPRMYTFETMVDFQYGPYERVNNETPPPPSTLKGDDKYRVFYDDLIIKEPTTTWTRDDKYRVFYDDLIIKEPTTTLDSFLSKNTPLFLPPIQFSRQDLPFNYNFAPRHRSSEYIELEEKCHILPVTIWSEMAQWLAREFTDWKVRGSNPTEASRLSLSRLGQPGSIPALMLPPVHMTFRH
ncbi:hypothetical protein T265_05902 [Opisthorchis viverrini]|uniref:Transcription factor IIIC subunit Tfc1/Sfc1 triple barrel domain-containing protein n=1 Tax=Opisthorchis viverrini TaxID=6198 RepID=A0A075AEP0_OPIVI|nr:hypothetical protein T265_05902 [Opisthorchis viverrini]KER26914.1 hypothetical protein T265_05902 [Opisthorchis viverrini]